MIYSWLKPLFPLLLALTVAGTVLIFCLTNNRLPRSSGEVELLFPAHSESLEKLHYERQVFEDVYTDTIVLSKGSNPFGGDDYFLLEELEAELLALDGVSSLILPRGDQTHDLFGLLSPDRHHIRAILKIQSSLTEQERSSLNAEIWQVLGNYSELSPIRAGSFVTTQEVALAVQRETDAIIPWIVVVLLAALLLLTRSIAVSLLVIGSTGLALVTSLLCFSALGFEMGPVSQLAPPFLLAVGTSFHLHFVSRYLTTAEAQRGEVSAELRRGIFMAALTTALSLLTLSLLDVADVTHFAVLASCGVLLAACFACFLQPPILLTYLKTHLNSKFFPLNRLFQLIRKPAIYLTLLVSIILAAGINRLEVHTDPLRFLPEKSDVLRQIGLVNSHFPGNHYLSVLAIPKSKQTLPGDFSFLNSLDRELLGNPSIEMLIGPHDFEKLLTKTHLSDFVSDFSLRESKIPAEFVSTDTGAFRLLVETSVEGRDLIELRSQLQQKLTATPELADYSIATTSLELIMAEQTANIVRGLIESLALTLSTVFLLLLFIFRSLRVALIGLVPNIIPLMSVFGVLGFTMRDLDFGSCLVAASALGIAVDNTFHFLLCWKSQCAVKPDLAAATGASVGLTAYPFSITSISLIAGFSMMFLAESLPVAHFGILLSITLFVGLFADLVVLPFLLSKGEVTFD